MARFYLYEIRCYKLLIDAQSKVIYEYDKDLYCMTCMTTFTKEDINVLIRRYQKLVEYDFFEDYFVYKHFMNLDEKSKCKYKPSKGNKKLIIETEDIKEILKELAK